MQAALAGLAVGLQAELLRLQCLFCREPEPACADLTTTDSGIEDGVQNDNTRSR
jgi:hypothetical protein